MKLKVEGRFDLDGTHRAIIETNSSEFQSLKSNENTPAIIKLQNSVNSCGCILSEVKRGPQNKVLIDRHKLWHLKARDGDFVEIEKITPPEAQNVEFLAPSDFSENDIIRFRGKPIIKGEKTALYTFSGDPRSILIGNTKPAGIVKLAASTSVTISTIADKDNGEIPITYKDIGGLNREISKLKEVIEFPLRFPEIFNRLGVTQPKGVILYGPPGTGKTLLAKALANEVGAKFYYISGPEIFDKYYGESEKKLRDVFTEAQKNSPSVILIDELDSLVPSRESTRGELERRIVASMLTLMDGLKKLKGVVVVGTTNRINSIDAALRREGRFGEEIHIGIPDSAGRKEILAIHTRKMPLAEDVNLQIIANKTHGFVGADLASLCREAAYCTVRRNFPPAVLNSKDEITINESINISQSDFEVAVKSIKPSGMREFLIEIPNVSWDEIGGLDDIKQLLMKNITYGITKRDVLSKFGVKPARGVLLYGPPGTGKTLLAKALASECGANFISIKGPELKSKWFGESEEKIRFIFSRAREMSPCVIFFDEIDAAVSTRGRSSDGMTDSITNQILSEMDGIESADGVFVIGATNRAELLDPALLRPGRFDYHIEVPLPPPPVRMAIFKVQLKNKPLSTDVNLERLVEMTLGFSGADIAEVCREATWAAIEGACFEADRVKVTAVHLSNAISQVKQNAEKLKRPPLGFMPPREE